jgi:hypothetical protein
LPDGAVTEERREEFERRLWWGYSKVGLRRIETQGFESALEPLFRALQFGGSDDERASETRGALVRALEGVVETSVAEIAQRGRRDRAGAMESLEKLVMLLRASTERGVRRDELTEAFARLTALREALAASSG